MRALRGYDADRKDLHKICRDLLLLVALICIGGAAMARDQNVGAISDLPCPPVNRAGQPPPGDYRLRDSTDSYRWAIQDNWKNHLGPAFTHMQSGKHTKPVMADINFTLHWWPNHLQGLKALIQYDLAGGQRYGYPPVECYFKEARRAFPDDPVVSIAEGTYFARKGWHERARRSYEEALAIDPGSAEAHYNLGLLYFDMADYSRAREHAVQAYSIGYPLPGLRDLLEKAGYSIK